VQPAGEGTPASGPVESPQARALLAAATSGDQRAEDQLLALSYDELHRLARSQLSRERAGHTLQPTALVNEAWLKLFGAQGLDLSERRPFLALAARAMRRVLVDHARTRARAKRGSGERGVEIDTRLVAPDRGSADVLAVDEALERLKALSERQARIVELRFFGGLEVEEVAEVLELSASTVERDWRAARAYLYDLLSDSA
jgi:RNA polymerase sigma factor (TIGR02999 family)